MIRQDRREGEPRTDEERRQRHYELYGEWPEELPPRGTGIAQDTEPVTHPFTILQTIGAVTGIVLSLILIYHFSQRK